MVHLGRTQIKDDLHIVLGMLIFYSSLKLVRRNFHQGCYANDVSIIAPVFLYPNPFHDSST